MIECHDCVTTWTRVCIINLVFTHILGSKSVRVPALVISLDMLHAMTSLPQHVLLLMCLDKCLVIHSFILQLSIFISFTKTRPSWSINAIKNCSRIQQLSSCSPPGMSNLSQVRFSFKTQTNNSRMIVKVINIFLGQLLFLSHKSLKYRMIKFNLQMFKN